tara:strand:- start:1965 stop:3170 length:1206 start_codon:yes stop_codon:yes gene_type:complete
MTFKPLQANDVVSTRTLLHEAIPLTGTIVSGTYNDENIKNYSHGMFQSVYDYPYLSSSANHIFDLTVGYSTDSALYTATATANGQRAKKKNIYNQMCQVLMGYDATGSILKFDEDGDIIGGGRKMNEVIIMPFSRLLVKDEIKKESFSMTLGVSGSYWDKGLLGKRDPFANAKIKIMDVSASSEYRVNSPVGEYGILYATSSVAGANGQQLETNATCVHTASIGGFTYWYAGLLFYQAGIAVLTASLFQENATATTNPGALLKTLAGGPGEHFRFISGSKSGGAGLFKNVNEALTGSAISASCAAFRHRIANIQFNNTTELNSTVYFCRANHNEFNYSSNPTYLSGSKIRVKSQASDDPVAYITTVGLYNDNNELMATAKLSEPLKKSPSTEFTIRTRLDY